MDDFYDWSQAEINELPAKFGDDQHSRAANAAAAASRKAANKAAHAANWAIHVARRQAAQNAVN